MIKVNVGGNRQPNPISYCSSNSSEQRLVIVTGAAAKTLFPGFLSSFRLAQMQNNCLLQDCSDKHKTCFCSPALVKTALISLIV